MIVSDNILVSHNEILISKIKNCSDCLRCEIPNSVESEEFIAVVEGIEDGVDAEAGGVGEAVGVVGGVGVVVPAFAGGVEVEEAAKGGVVEAGAHVDEAVFEGGVAEESGIAEEGGCAAFANYFFSVGGVCKAVGDTACFVCEGGGVAEVVEVVVGDGAVGIDLIGEADAPDIAGSLSVLGVII